MARPQQPEKREILLNKLGLFVFFFPLTKQLDNQVPFQRWENLELSTIRTSFSVAIPSSRNIINVRG
jgi:hypothetical protein